ncbi:MAG: ABC transporter ATP-binding protein [Deltaproteobacteria bacterium]|nr:ABC transporter ATP-binding protein [Deltaproteobacteria bacterium]
MLEVRDLRVRYGGITALAGVDLRVEEGEIVTLIGSNGAGKSTLLGAVCGLVKPAGGAVSFLGRPTNGRKTHQLAREGLILVPEGRRVFANLTVRENLLLGGFSRPQDAALKADIAEIFQLFPRLAERQSQAAGTLSGGEQQMLALGRALMGKPKLLMMDEPSLGLAPLLVAEVFHIIQHIHANGVTVLLVEQNAAAALSVADRGYVLENGRVVLAASGRELAADGRVQRAYLGMD